MHQPKEPTDLSLLEEMGYEPQDVDVNHMPKHAIGLFVSIIVVIALAYFIMLLIEPNSVGRRDAAEFRVMPESPNPLLQTNTTAHLDMVKMREHENEVMHGYGWTDADTGKAHVPVERAMDMVLEEGLPTRSYPRHGESLGLPLSEGADTAGDEPNPVSTPPIHDEPGHSTPPASDPGHEEAGH